MTVAIAGAGIAGSYLARLLQEKGITADLFDGMEHETSCRCRSCGWGAPVGIGNYLAMAGLDFDTYLMEPMFSMNFDGLVAKTPLCTINKPLLLRDLGSGLPCTGNHWISVKPKPMMLSWMQPGYSGQFCLPGRSDLILPTVQHRVRVESPRKRTSRGRGAREPDPGIGTGGLPSGMGRTISVLAGFILTSTRASCNGFTRRTLIGLPSPRSAAAEE